MAEEEDSDFGESTRRRNKRKIVMRIEYGDSSSDISADEKVGRRKGELGELLLCRKRACRRIYTLHSPS